MSRVGLEPTTLYLRERDSYRRDDENRVEKMRKNREKQTQKCNSARPENRIFHWAFETVDAELSRLSGLPFGDSNEKSQCFVH